MGEQLEERRATLISDALDLPDELDSTEYLRGAKKKQSLDSAKALAESVQ